MGKKKDEEEEEEDRQDTHHVCVCGEDHSIVLMQSGE